MSIATIYPKPRLWNRNEYYRASENGIFAADERLELIDGEVFKKVSPQGARHAVAVYQTAHTLEDKFGAGICVLSESPITLNDQSEPEPDVVVVSGSIRDYVDHHPGPAEIVLIVEISDSTLAFDRTVKSRLYATANIAEYWIVNLVDRRLEVFRSPRAQVGYAISEIFLETDTASPTSIPGQQIAIQDLLP